ncbi:MAG: hypothetical protein K2X74_17915, partial [Acetobacteraceae bacterium]|nr:hypothetical protein [Acetobacteraceae bacterium]
MALADILKPGLAKSLTIVGPAGGNNSPGNLQARCGPGQRTVDIVTEAVTATVATGTAGHGGDTLTLAASAAPAAGAYWLAWNPWRAYITHLGAAKRFFVTANLTGCGIIVAGDETDPYVVHANCAAASVVDFPKSGSMQTYNDDLTAERNVFYGQVAAELVRLNHIPSRNLQMLRPEDYGKRASEGFGGVCAVFGVSDGARWKLYYNVGNGGKGITRQL